MKKILSVFLAALMICSAFSVMAFAEEKYPAPAAPSNLALTADGIASWDAVDVPSFTEDESGKYETTCVIKYKVTLVRWDYDDKENTWAFTPAGDEIMTEETSLDLSTYMVSGKYVFSVMAVAEYTRIMHTTNTDNEGNPIDKTANFKKLSETVTLDRENAVQVVDDLYAEPIDDSIPFESLVDEENEQATGILKILKKIKEVFMILLRFVNYAGDKTGISEEIRNKKG